jgi:phosphate transport system substrate-binding protein
MKKITLLVLALVAVITLAACGGESFDTTQTVNVYTRDTESGTREAFFKGIDFDDAAEDDSILVATKTVVSGNSDMIAKVVADEYGIGYISLSSLEGSGVIGLDYEGVEATEANVLNDTYGLKRPFNYISREAGDFGSDAQEEITAALVAYMSTAEGKAIIAENGGIVEMSSSDENWADISGDYTICSADNSSVDLYVGGSTSVEKIAKALTADFKGKCGNFNPLHNHEGSSAAFKGTQLDETKDAAATYLDLGFASRGFKDTEAGAAGTFGQICWDAVVAVVNEANTSITNITAEELKKLYDGTVTSWDGLTE